MRRVGFVALGLLVLASNGDAQGRSIARTTSIAMPRGVRVEAVASGDVNGDGASDLVLACSRGRRGRRMLYVHFRRDGPAVFGPEPDQTFDLLPDVTAFAVGDVHADPGGEIVLFTAKGAFALRPTAENERERYAKIAAAEFLWQLPHERRIVAWSQGVRDVDDDGLLDVLIPEPSGYVVARQKRSPSNGATFDVSRLELPETVAGGPASRGSTRRKSRSERRQIAVRVGIRSDDEADDLLAVHESTPAPVLTDWNGDGLADLLAQTPDALHVWLQSRADGFSTSPDVIIELPLEVDRRRLLDVSYSAQAADLDGDGRSDYVLVAGDQRSEDVRAQVAVYLQGAAGSSDDTPLFGAKGRPRQLLLVAGIAGDPRLRDVDADGRPDLVLGSLRLDALDVLRAAGGGTLDAELYVYRNTNGRFSRTPDLTVPLSMPAKGMRKARETLAARFFGDVTGDGILDLLLRDRPEQLRVLMVRRARDKLAVVERPLFATSVDPGAELHILPRLEGGSPDLVLASRNRVLHVGFVR